MEKEPSFKKYEEGRTGSLTMLPANDCEILRVPDENKDDGIIVGHRSIGQHRAACTGLSEGKNGKKKWQIRYEMRWGNRIEPTGAHDTIRTSGLCLWAMTTFYFWPVVPSSVDILNSVVQTAYCVCFFYFIFIISNDFSFVFFAPSPKEGGRRTWYSISSSNIISMFTLCIWIFDLSVIYMTYLLTRSVLFFGPVLVIRRKEGRYHLITCNAADLKHRAASDCSGSRRRVKFHCWTKISFIWWGYMVPWPLPSFHCWRRPIKIVKMEKRARDRRCQRRRKKNHTMELNYIIFFSVGISLRFIFQRKQSTQPTIK